MGEVFVFGGFFVFGGARFSADVFACDCRSSARSALDCGFHIVFYNLRGLRVGDLFHHFRRGGFFGAVEVRFHLCLLYTSKFIEFAAEISEIREFDDVSARRNFEAMNDVYKRQIYNIIEFMKNK